MIIDDIGIELVKKILRTIIVILVLICLGYLFFGCSSTKVNGRYMKCNPKRPVAIIHPFPSQPEIILKGYDEDCDGRIDYWQHFKHGKPFARRINVKRR